MSIFPNLELEDKIQLNDKTRLDARKSFVSVDEALITLVEIQPEATGSFIDVTVLKYLDWEYEIPGTKAVTVRITTDGAAVTRSKNIEAVDAATDALFSSDEQLTSHEPDILKYVRAGRNSFLNKHRESQTRIMGWLDEHRVTDIQGKKLSIASIVDVTEVSEWSKYQTLQFIFEGISNDVDDIFSDKAKKYGRMVEETRNRAVLRLDVNGDGEIDLAEGYDMRSGTLVRR